MTDGKVSEVSLSNHPPHYNASAIECIEIVRWLSFNLGNAVKYLWRFGLKDSPKLEVDKAVWYLDDEILRLSRPVAKWARPMMPIRWSEDFGKHLETLAPHPTTEALYDIREAVLAENFTLLVSARRHLSVLSQGSQKDPSRS